MASCKPPTVFCQRERALATSCWSVADIETLPYWLWNAFPTSNKQLLFLQHIYLALKPGGRAAVVLPDNVLFEDGVGRRVRTHLMETCDVHTLLRLPSGIFYAADVKTSVLFFSRPREGESTTQRIWVYDLRTNMQRFRKGRNLTNEVFADFVRVYGSDPLGRGPRDHAADPRFRVVC